MVVTDPHALGGQRTASPSPIDRLRDGFRGEILVAGDAEYDEVRQVFNRMIDRRPALIARCRGTGDVVRAVNYAREQGLPIAVRGGGHGVAGYAVCDDGVMIDLSLMTGVTVDPERRIAVAGPGVRLGELIEATEAYGLVTPTGTASDTGIAGLTLGGGFGWLAGKFGMAVDNLVAAEVVTAAGEVVRASADEHPDLLWALRGGSGNFGVVTAFEFQLHPLSQVLGGMLIYPFDRAREVLAQHRAITAVAPDELTTYAAIVTPPGSPGPMVALIFCWSGPVAEGEAYLAPLRAWGPPLADTIQPISYSAMNRMVDDGTPPGMRLYWRQSLLREVNDDVIDTLVDFGGRLPSPFTTLILTHEHGASARVPVDATAFPNRNSPHGVVALVCWHDPADDAVNIAWNRSLSDALRPHGTGGIYVNEAVDERHHTAFGPNYERLTRIKRTYDPENLFRLNVNIPPATAEA